MSRIALLLVATIGVLVAISRWQPVDREWSAEDIEVLSSLSLSALPELPTDPTNRVADNKDAVVFGALLFNDARLSADGSVSCATCHQPERRFTDGLQKGKGLGETRRNTPSIVGTAYSPWQYWDGRRDSQWAQALSPLEDIHEHGVTRDDVVALIGSDPRYRGRYELLFGGSPDNAPSVDVVFANIGKVLAAFERTLMPTASRFDEYVAAVVAGDSDAQAILFDDDEVRGLRLFVGEAECLQCHNGPLLTNNEFHNTGVLSFPGEVPDRGRIAAVDEVFADPFNCQGAFSDDETRACPELEFARRGIELLGAMRTPSLRNLTGTEPYMHKGQLATLMDVLQHYNEAPDAMIGHNEAEPLGLSDRELRQLEAFLHTLDAPVAGTAF